MHDIVVSVFTKQEAANILAASVPRLQGTPQVRLEIGRDGELILTQLHITPVPEEGA